MGQTVTETELQYNGIVLQNSFYKFAYQNIVSDVELDGATFKTNSRQCSSNLSLKLNKFLIILCTCTDRHRYHTHTHTSNFVSGGNYG